MYEAGTIFHVVVQWLGNFSSQELLIEVSLVLTLYFDTVLQNIKMLSSHQHNNSSCFNCFKKKSSHHLSIVKDL